MLTAIKQAEKDAEKEAANVENELLDPDLEIYCGNIRFIAGSTGKNFLFLFTVCVDGQGVEV